MTEKWGEIQGKLDLVWVSSDFELSESSCNLIIFFLHSFLSYNQRCQPLQIRNLQTFLHVNYCFPTSFINHSHVWDNLTHSDGQSHTIWPRHKFIFMVGLNWLPFTNFYLELRTERLKELAYMISVFKVSFMWKTILSTLQRVKEPCLWRSYKPVQNYGYFWIFFNNL